MGQDPGTKSYVNWIIEMFGRGDFQYALYINARISFPIK